MNSRKKKAAPKKIAVIRGGIAGVILAVLFIVDLRTQYSTAIGIRIGGTTGIVAKHFYKPSLAGEGIIGAFGNGFSLTGLVEKYDPIYNATGFYIFYGGGVHMAFYNGHDNRRGSFGREVDYRNNNGVGVGINGIVGIEYRMQQNTPLSFSLDLKPFVEFGSGGYVSVAPDPSIGIRYIIR